MLIDQSIYEKDTLTEDEETFVIMESQYDPMDERDDHMATLFNDIYWYLHLRKTKSKILTSFEKIELGGTMDEELDKQRVQSPRVLAATKIAVGTAQGAIRTLKKLFSGIAELTTSMASALRSSIVSEAYIHKQFTKLHITLDKHATDERLYVDAPTYEDCSRRLAGLISVVKHIGTLAETCDRQSFTQDGIWDELTEKAGGVFKCNSPKAGATFKTIQWVPYTRTKYDIKESKWMEASARQTLEQLTVTLKKDMTAELLDASAILKKICSGVMADVSNTTDDDIPTVNKTVAATYLITRLIRQIHAVLVKEANTMAVINIRRLTIFGKE